MVGPPKTLSYLSRISAQVRVTCRSCRATEVWELQALITEVTSNGGRTDWHLARYAVKYPKRCASPMVDLLALPCGKQRARRRAYRHALLNLALQILHEATQRSAREAVGTIEVRLALHVLRPFVRDAALLTEFWDPATVEPRHAWASCQGLYRRIVQRLTNRARPSGRSIVRFEDTGVMVPSRPRRELTVRRVIGRVCGQARV